MTLFSWSLENVATWFGALLIKISTTCFGCDAVIKARKSITNDLGLPLGIGNTTFALYPSDQTPHFSG